MANANEVQLTSGPLPLQSNTRKKSSILRIAPFNEPDMTGSENNHVAIDDLINFNSREGLFAASNGADFPFDNNWMREMPGMVDMLGGDLIMLDGADM